jgi:hypothetical protein
MAGHPVLNIAMGAPHIQSLRRVTRLPPNPLQERALQQAWQAAIVEDARRGSVSSWSCEESLQNYECIPRLQRTDH